MTTPEEPIVKARTAERDVATEAAMSETREHLLKIMHLAEFSPEAKVSDLVPLVKRLIAILESAHAPGDTAGA